MTTYRNVFFLLCCLFTRAAYCQQTTPFYNLSTGNDSVSINEKIYVHTDKNVYVAGEILWFKIYNVNAATNQLSGLSKVTYIELIDSLNKPVAQAKIGLHSGTGNGSFDLSPSVSSGSYKLRAYTSWMKNNGAEDFFEKNVTIINVQKLTLNKKEKEKEQVSVRFFPEGGTLVYGLESHVACQGSNSYGKGVAFNGWLLDNNDTLSTFRSDANGVAGFDITPLQNHSYKAIVQPQNETTAFMQSLPDITARGYVMNTGNSNDSNLVVNVLSVGESEAKVYLLIHKNNTALVARENTLNAGKTFFTIPKNLLPGGASYITIFDERRQPVCERLYFKKKIQQLMLATSVDQPEYDTRKKVTISVAAQNLKASDDSAFLSMSVYRLDSLQSVDEDKIETYLFFSSELKGDMTQADKYLSNDEALNNLLLVRSRFIPTKEKEKRKSFFQFAPEYNGLILTGNIISKQTGLPQRNSTVFLSVTGKGTQFYPGVSDADGNIRWETKKFYGASKLVIQTDGDSSSVIRLNTPFSQLYSSTFVPLFLLPANAPNTLSEHSISMQVPHIYSGTNREQFAVPQYDTIPFYASADKTYKLDNYTRFNTLEEVLREYIALVNVTKRKSDYHLPVYDNASQKMFTDDPLVLLDGVPFFNLTHFISFDPQKIQRLDIVYRRFFYGDAMFDGILDWHSYDGGLAETDLDPRALMVDYEGLALQREFYSPHYETEEQRSSHVPDFRNVLYWNPNITLKEKQQLSFYTSDLPGRYAVVVQGITQSGLAGSGTAIFDVKK